MSNTSAIRICLLYPDLLGTYGDGGNAVVLERRAQWRDIEVDVVPVSIDEAVPEQCDIYLLGGGEDQPQTSVTDHLGKSRALHRAVDAGAAVFAVCAGMQILGQSFAVAGDAVKDGLGLIDVTTVRGDGDRRVGELVVDVDDDIGIGRLSGYENHGGITRLGTEARALGTVVVGNGNDDGRGSEGVVQGRIVGTYLHGPALARNPRLADLLLGWVTSTSLTPLDDAEVDELRAERFSAAMKSRSITALRKRDRLRRLVRK